MGCATSALGIQRTSPDFDRHLLEEQELAKLTAPPPKIPLTVGSGVQKYNENKVGVVFIFGNIIFVCVLTYQFVSTTLILFSIVGW